MKRLTYAVLVLAVVLFGARAAWAQEEEAPIVREIEVRFAGPETVNRAIVLANIQTAVGKPLTRQMAEQDVRNLIATGFFLDVRIVEERVKDGIKVIFHVQGKATLREILYEGNKQYKADRLKRDCTLKVGDILDEQKAHADALKMIELYQKAAYPDVKVEPITSIDRDTGKAVLKFKVTEGSRVFIQRIEFHGNKAFPALSGFLWFQSGLLKEMKTKRHWWGSWLAGTGVLKDEQFQEDLDKIREFYRSHGYIDMEVRGTRIERVGTQWMIVHIDLFEGQQYKVGEITIKDTKLFPVVELRKKLKMTTDQVFTPEGLTKDTKALEDYYGARGYLDTGVVSTRVPNVKTGRIDLTYTLHEGQLTYIEKVNIRGNTKTKDKVIRRELAAAPGEIYDTVRIERSVERLKNLNYFSKVDTTPDPTSIPNHRDLTIALEEQQTGTMTFGAGFSSIDNLIGFVEMTQGNFDLFNWPHFTGAGQKLRIRLQVGFERQDYILSFTEPWFMDQKLALGFDLFHHSASYLSTKFNESRTGADVRMEKAINEFVRATVQYGIQSIHESVEPLSSAELRSQAGTKIRSGVELGLVYDTRDSVFLTTRGNRTELSAELVGGPFAGDVSVYKVNARTSFYFPFFDKQVLQILAAGGVVDAYGQSKVGAIVNEDPNPFRYPRKVDDVPIFDRYFLGGANTLRGFSYRKVGPRDITGEPIGGNTYFNATAEYSIPVVERVRFAVFYDIGDVWRDSYQVDFGNLKSDAGIGVRLNLPIGPLRLDYGYPLQSDRLTGRGGHVQFSVGYQF